MKTPRNINSRSKLRAGAFLIAFGLFMGMFYVPSRSRATGRSSAQDEKTAAQSRGKSDVPAHLKEIALGHVAERRGRQSDELEEVNSSSGDYPLSGRTAFSFKIRDKHSRQVSNVTLNPDGQELDPKQLLADEQAAYAAKYGKLEPALADLLTVASAGEPVDVVIWLKEPSFAGPPRPQRGKRGQSPLTRGEVDEFREKLNTQLAAHVRPVVAPVATRLRQMGFVAEVDKYSPILIAQLLPETIREVEQWESVDLIYLAKTYDQAMAVARPTIGADVVNTRGFNGTGVQVGMVEIGGRVNTANPHLPGMTINATYDNGTMDPHGTLVAGIIRSNHPDAARGVAPSAQLYAAGVRTDNPTTGATLPLATINTNLQTVSNGAITWGAKALNHSWGRDNALVPGTMDRFFDRMVINNLATIVVAAGNRETGFVSPGVPCQFTDGNVNEPGLGYNMITVGNFNDMNTTAVADDVMGPCSSWRNPTSTNTDRQKPEVAAPGTNINGTAIAAPWDNYSDTGTSFAAPMVTGTAALLMDRDVFFETNPEALKAVLMVTATHNIEGNTDLSERDGAGGIVANQADDVANFVNGDADVRAYTCSSSTITRIATANLRGGVPARLIISWTNNPSYSAYNTQLGADIDLEIVDTAGNVVAGSYRWDDAYDIVQFTPPANGTYYMEIYKNRCSYNPRYVGWAWHQGV